MTSEPESDGISRRSLIKAASATIPAGVAGCTSDGTTAESVSVITETTIEGKTLTVTMDQSEQVDRFALFDPDGRTIDTTEITTGSSRVDLSIADYRPGEQRLAAIKATDDGDEEILDEQAFSLEPDLQIVDIAVYDNVEDELNDETSGRHMEPVLWVENIGNVFIDIDTAYFYGDGLPGGGFAPGDGSRTPGFTNRETPVTVLPAEKLVLVYGSLWPFMISANQSVPSEKEPIPFTIQLNVNTGNPLKAKSAVVYEEITNWRVDPIHISADHRPPKMIDSANDG